MRTVSKESSNRSFEALGGSKTLEDYLIIDLFGCDSSDEHVASCIAYLVILCVLNRGDADLCPVYAELAEGGTYG